MNEIAKPLPSYSSVFQAEAIAIRKVCEIINNKNLSNLKFELNSDSQAVLKALQKRTTKNDTIKLCHNTRNKLGENNKITLNWVPRHQGTRVMKELTI